MMRVVILGCGGSAGVPQLGGEDGRGDWGACDPSEPRNQRTRSSILIEQDGRRLLIDTGPDLRAQLLATGIAGIDAVLFTHAHADHITGLDDVRILNRLTGKPIDAYGSPKTIEELTLRFDYAFRPWKPPGFYRPVLVPHQVEAGQDLTIAGFPVTLLDQDHGYVRSLGLRIGRFAYSTDVVAMDAEVLDRLKGIDTWVVGCFQRQKHATHAHIALVAQWAARIGVRRTVLTHMGYDLDWAWMQANLPPGLEPGFDGMEIHPAS
ncbi:Metal-dependent hydrolase [Granulibacter bethesdensis]|nr:Metal-dependent hydrolase [Granulibacter bethesdensis CGDNIH4]APH59418.1 Metal-dependent hydrolase [Granulibacter bethesdensis]